MKAILGVMYIVFTGVLTMAQEKKEEIKVHETIDLSNQKEGIYLLEIQKGKRLTRKFAID